MNAELLAGLQDELARVDCAIQAYNDRCPVDNEWSRQRGLEYRERLERSRLDLIKRINEEAA